jgi:NAD(P)H-nitrite reductase large subunit
MSRQDRAIVPIQAAADKPYLDSADYVIIGNGIAGLTAALEARRLAPDKRIVVITEQIHPTINTPALKQFAIGKLNREQLLAYPAGTERMERIHVVTARVQEIHAKSKYVSLNGDRGFGYGSLLIATGSKPAGLPATLPGRDFDGVLTLHRLQDYLDLRRRLPEVEQAVVIGGGVHAIETVMGLLHWGIRVHWLIRSATFMPRVLDEISSEMVLERVRRAGAIVYTETEVVGIVGRIGVVAGVITNHQKMIPCDLVLSCTGTQAVTDLAKHCSVPLKHERGIMVDDQLRTSGPDIYAAGDVAALKSSDRHL